MWEIIVQNDTPCRDEKKIPKMDNGRTPLHIAALNDHYEVCRCLLEYLSEDEINSKDNDGKTALILAAEGENWDSVADIADHLRDLDY